MPGPKEKEAHSNKDKALAVALGAIARKSPFKAKPGSRRAAHGAASSSSDVSESSYLQRYSRHLYGPAGLSFDFDRFLVLDGLIQKAQEEHRSSVQESAKMSRLIRHYQLARASMVVANGAAYLPIMPGLKDTKAEAPVENYAVRAAGHASWARHFAAFELELRSLDLPNRQQSRQAEFNRKLSEKMRVCQSQTQTPFELAYIYRSFIEEQSADEFQHYLALEAVVKNLRDSYWFVDTEKFRDVPLSLKNQFTEDFQTLVQKFKQTPTPKSARKISELMALYKTFFGTKIEVDASTLRQLYEIQNAVDEHEVQAAAPDAQADQSALDFWYDLLLNELGKSADQEGDAAFYTYLKSADETTGNLAPSEEKTKAFKAYLEELSAAVASEQQYSWWGILRLELERLFDEQVVSFARFFQKNAPQSNEAPPLENFAHVSALSTLLQRLYGPLPEIEAQRKESEDLLKNRLDGQVFAEKQTLAERTKQIIGVYEEAHLRPFFDFLHNNQSLYEQYGPYLAVPPRNLALMARLPLALPETEQRQLQDCVNKVLENVQALSVASLTLFSEVYREAFDVLRGLLSFEQRRECRESLQDLITPPASGLEEVHVDHLYDRLQTGDAENDAKILAALKKLSAIVESQLHIAPVTMNYMRNFPDLLPHDVPLLRDYIPLHQPFEQAELVSPYVFRAFDAGENPILEPALPTFFDGLLGENHSFSFESFSGEVSRWNAQAVRPSAPLGLFLQALSEDKFNTFMPDFIKGGPLELKIPETLQIKQKSVKNEKKQFTLGDVLQSEALQNRRILSKLVEIDYLLREVRQLTAYTEDYLNLAGDRELKLEALLSDEYIQSLNTVLSVRTLFIDLEQEMAGLKLARNQATTEFLQLILSAIQNDTDELSRALSSTLTTDRDLLMALPSVTFKDAKRKESAREFLAFTEKARGISQASLSCNNIELRIFKRVPDLVAASEAGLVRRLNALTTASDQVDYSALDRLAENCQSMAKLGFVTEEFNQAMAAMCALPNDALTIQASDVSMKKAHWAFLQLALPAEEYEGALTFEQFADRYLSPAFGVTEMQDQGQCSLAKNLFSETLYTILLGEAAANQSEGQLSNAKFFATLLQQRKFFDTAGNIFFSEEAQAAFDLLPGNIDANSFTQPLLLQLIARRALKLHDPEVMGMLEVAMRTQSDLLQASLGDGGKHKAEVAFAAPLVLALIQKFGEAFSSLNQGSSNFSNIKVHTATYVVNYIKRALELESSEHDFSALLDENEAVLAVVNSVDVFKPLMLKFIRDTLALEQGVSFSQPKLITLVARFGDTDRCVRVLQNLLCQGVVRDWALVENFYKQVKARDDTFEHKVSNLLTAIAQEETIDTALQALAAAEFFKVPVEKQVNLALVLAERTDHIEAEQADFFECLARFDDKEALLLALAKLRSDAEKKVAPYKLYKLDITSFALRGIEPLRTIDENAYNKDNPNLVDQEIAVARTNLFKRLCLTSELDGNTKISDPLKAIIATASDDDDSSNVLQQYFGEDNLASVFASIDYKLSAMTVENFSDISFILNLVRVKQALSAVPEFFKFKRYSDAFSEAYLTALSEVLVARGKLNWDLEAVIEKAKHHLTRLTAGYEKIDLLKVMFVFMQQAIEAGKLTQGELECKINTLLAGTESLTLCVGGENAKYSSTKTIDVKAYFTSGLSAVFAKKDSFLTALHTTLDGVLQGKLFALPEALNLDKMESILFSLSSHDLQRLEEKIQAAANLPQIQDNDFTAEQWLHAVRNLVIYYQTQKSAPIDVLSGSEKGSDVTRSIVSSYDADKEFRARIRLQSPRVDQLIRALDKLNADNIVKTDADNIVSMLALNERPFSETECADFVLVLSSQTEIEGALKLTELRAFLSENNDGGFKLLSDKLVVFLGQQLPAKKIFADIYGKIKDANFQLQNRDASSPQRGRSIHIDPETLKWADNTAKQGNFEQEKSDNFSHALAAVLAYFSHLGNPSTAAGPSAASDFKALTAFNLQELWPHYQIQYAKDSGSIVKEILVSLRATFAKLRQDLPFSQSLEAETFGDAFILASNFVRDFGDLQQKRELGALLQFIQEQHQEYGLPAKARYEPQWLKGLVEKALPGRMMQALEAADVPAELKTDLVRSKEAALYRQYLSVDAADNYQLFAQAQNVEPVTWLAWVAKNAKQFEVFDRLDFASLSRLASDYNKVAQRSNNKVLEHAQDFSRSVACSEDLYAQLKQLIQPGVDINTVANEIVESLETMQNTVIILTDSQYEKLGRLLAEFPDRNVILAQRQRPSIFLEAQLPEGCVLDVEALKSGIRSYVLYKLICEPSRNYRELAEYCTPAALSILRETVQSKHLSEAVREQLNGILEANLTIQPPQSLARQQALAGLYSAMGSHALTGAFAGLKEKTAAAGRVNNLDQCLSHLKTIQSSVESNTVLNLAFLQVDPTMSEHYKQQLEFVFALLVSYCFNLCNKLQKTLEEGDIKKLSEHFTDCDPYKQLSSLKAAINALPVLYAEQFSPVFARLDEIYKATQDKVTNAYRPQQQSHLEEEGSSNVASYSAARYERAHQAEERKAAMQRLSDLVREKFAPLLDRLNVRAIPPRSSISGASSSSDESLAPEGVPSLAAAKEALETLYYDRDDLKADDKYKSRLQAILAKYVLSPACFGLGFDDVLMKLGCPVVFAEDEQRQLERLESSRDSLTARLGVLEQLREKVKGSGIAPELREALSKNITDTAEQVEKLPGIEGKIKALSKAKRGVEDFRTKLDEALLAYAERQPEAAAEYVLSSSRYQEFLGLNPDANTVANCLYEVPSVRQLLDNPSSMAPSSGTVTPPRSGASSPGSPWTGGDSRDSSPARTSLDSVRRRTPSPDGASSSGAGSSSASTSDTRVRGGSLNKEFQRGEKRPGHQATRSADEGGSGPTVSGR